MKLKKKKIAVKRGRSKSSVNTITKQPKKYKLEDKEDDRFENAKEHKAQLAALAEKDPEFYKFLQEQDADLLEFDESDVDTCEGSWEELSKSDSEENKDDTDTPSKLEFRLDKDGRKILDQTVVDNLNEFFWIKTRPSPSKVRLGVEAFLACVARVGANIDPPNYVVNDQQIFENLIRFCFQHLSKAIYVLLDPIEAQDIEKEEVKDEASIEITKDGVDKEKILRFRKWKKYHLLVKKYLSSLLLFINELQSPEVVIATLQVLSQLVSLYVHFKKMAKSLIKTVVRIWSRRTDECRCVAFIVLCKVIRLNKNLYTIVLKSCYVAYVSNVRLITPGIWPSIIFMQKSFAEICALHTDIAYHYAFIYIRQMAIHLRNAMIAKRKDLLQTVYNWQFIMCLFLWARVIGKAYRIKNVNEHANAIVELGYPLIQITTTTLKLFPSSRFFPLRLHCLRILLMIQVNCGVFIPTLPLAIELLDEAAILIKKKPTKGKGTIKASDFNCLLKISTSQLEEAGFRQSALEALFKLQLEAAYIIRNHCSFPDIMVPLDGKIRAFIKQCKNSDHARLFKSLSTKLSEHAKYVADIVAKSKVDLNDRNSLKTLNALITSEESPLSKFYSCWRNVWKIPTNEVSKAGGSLEPPQAIKSVDVKSAAVSHEVPRKNDGAKKAKILDETCEENNNMKAKISKKRIKNKKMIEMRNRKLPSEEDDELLDLVLSDSD